jgi:hypothetical protein
MPDPVLKEEPLQFGEGGRLFGILTLPAVSPRNARQLPAFVFLSAGLLHRVGPGRLHVRLARELAGLGFDTLRVDLAGIGDSPRRPGLLNQQSVAADYKEIVSVLESRLGRLQLVLGGLCSGADNTIRLTPADERVIGMLLLDPVCFPDSRFNARALLARYGNPARYIRWFKRRIKAVTIPFQERWKRIDPLALRDIPSREQLRAAFEAIRERDGRVLSVFSQYALRDYYNQSGQLAQYVGVDGYHDYCTELFWPHAEHTYPLEVHRQRLIETVKTWTAGFKHS